MKKINYPKIMLEKAEPFQERFEDGTGNYWGVARLIDDTKELQAFDCSLASLCLSSQPWKDFNLLDIATHCKRVNEADLSKPIILSWEGSIADGRHRVIKAIVLGKRTVKAVRMYWRPTPCGYDGE